MTIKEALITFLKEYHPDGDAYVTELEATDDIFRVLEQDAPHVIERFIINFYDRAFRIVSLPHEFRTKKAILLGAVFGKEKAREMLHNEVFMKGQPAISYIEYTFGEQAAQELLVILEGKGFTNMMSADNYRQIVCLRHLFENHLGKLLPDLVPRMRLDMASYLKNGASTTKPLLNWFSMSKYTVDDMKNALRELGLSEQAINSIRELGQIFKNKKLASSYTAGTAVHVEKRINSALERYSSYNTSTKVVAVAKNKAGIRDLNKSNKEQRIDFVNEVLVQEPFNGFSPQKESFIYAILSSYLNL